MRPGQDLVAAGYVGLKGTAVAAAEKEPLLLTRFSRPFVDGCKTAERHCKSSKEQILTLAPGCTDCQAAGEGGVLAALWDFLEENGMGCDVELRSFPILQETVEVCEIFDLNPYRLKSEGCFLLAVDNGGDAVRALTAEGIRAAVIGKVAEGPGKRIHNGEIHSFLNRPEPDELNKILIKSN